MNVNTVHTDGEESVARPQEPSGLVVIGEGAGGSGRRSGSGCLGNGGKKMTDNEIIKILELCFTDNFGDCEGCPLKDKRDGIFSCMRTKQELALALINRQKAEVEKKDIEIAILIRKKEALNDEISDLKAEVEGAKLRYEEVKADRDKEHQYAMHYARMCAKAKSEAIKEFWEKAKQTREFRTCPYVYIADGDNLVEEMTE